MKDYFKILGVEQTADDATIKAAYRKLAMQYHPDKNPGNSEAEAKFKEISEAYEAIKDAEKRRAYKAQLEANRFRASQDAFHHSSAHAAYRRASDLDIDEILKDIRRKRFDNGFDAPSDAKNRDIVLTYHITLEESFHGKETELTYNVPGKSSKVLPLKIPAGIEDGIRIRYVGMGDNTMTHVPPGDLYVKISVMRHPTFVRHGANLSTSVTIDYLDAMLGTEVTVPTIEGTQIKVKIPAGIHPGQSLRATGKGMPTGTNSRGDMHIEVVIVPTILNPEQRSLVEQARAKRSS